MTHDCPTGHCVVSVHDGTARPSRTSRRCARKVHSKSLMPSQPPISPGMVEPVWTPKSCDVPVQPVSRSAPGHDEGHLADRRTGAIRLAVAGTCRRVGAVAELAGLAHVVAAERRARAIALAGARARAGRRRRRTPRRDRCWLSPQNGPQVHSLLARGAADTAAVAAAVALLAAVRRGRRRRTVRRCSRPGTRRRHVGSVAAVALLADLDRLVAADRRAARAVALALAGASASSAPSHSSLGWFTDVVAAAPGTGNRQAVAGTRPLSGAVAVLARIDHRRCRTALRCGNVCVGCRRPPGREARHAVDGAAESAGCRRSPRRPRLRTGRAGAHDRIEEALAEVAPRRSDPGHAAVARLAADCSRHRTSSRGSVSMLQKRSNGPSRTFAVVRVVGALERVLRRADGVVACVRLRRLTRPAAGAAGTVRWRRCSGAAVRRRRRSAVRRTSVAAGTIGVGVARLGSASWRRCRRSNPAAGSPERCTWTCRWSRASSSRSSPCRSTTSRLPMLAALSPAGSRSSSCRRTYWSRRYRRAGPASARRCTCRPSRRRAASDRPRTSDTAGRNVESIVHRRLEADRGVGPPACVIPAVRDVDGPGHIGRCCGWSRTRAPPPRRAAAAGRRSTRRSRARCTSTASRGRIGRASCCFGSLRLKHEQFFDGPGKTIGPLMSHCPHVGDRCRCRSSADGPR